MIIDYERDALNQEDLWDSIQPQANIPTGGESSRLSVQNIDWDNINAHHLFTLFSSFCKTGQSRILKVEIYPSQYGVEEMEKEKMQGPDRDIFEEGKKRGIKVIHGLDDILQEEEEEDLTGFNQVKLRKYEMKKLKYYFAVVYCDSIETASHIYNECDNMEIERTQSFLDLRFIPDSIKDFLHKPKEVCDYLKDDYDPNFGNNRAISHSKVKLTWEAGDSRREDILKKAFKKGQFKEEEINEYIVSSDSEDDEDARVFAESLKKTSTEDNDLKLLKKKRNNDTPLDIKEGQEIEITFNTGLENMSTSNGKAIQSFTTKNVDSKDSQWVKFKMKKKEKKAQKKNDEKKRKEKIKKLRNKNYSDDEEDDDDEDDEDENESEVEEENTKDKKVEASKAELELLFNNETNNFNFNAKDSRFKAIYNDKNYAIDPTDSNFKKNTKIIEAVNNKKSNSHKLKNKSRF